MKINKSFEKIPERTCHNSRDRVLLTRQANKLFNEGQISQAKELYIAAGYSNGLRRMGDHYFMKNDFISALKMYKLASDDQKVEVISSAMAKVMRSWLAEDKNK